MSEIDHERIWLEPKCCADPDGGRTWCEDNVFDCEEGGKPTEYVRADRLTTLSLHNAKLVEALTTIKAITRDNVRGWMNRNTDISAQVDEAFEQIVALTDQALNEGVQP